MFLPTEDGLSNITGPRFPLLSSYGSIMQAIGELCEGEHQFGTAIIDSVDWLEPLVWKQVCDCNPKNGMPAKSIEDYGYGKGYGMAGPLWQDILDGLNYLRTDRGMHIILIGHCKVEKFENPETEAYDRYAPRLHKVASALVQEWCDEVLFASYKVFTRETDEGFQRKRTRGIGSSERVIRTVEQPFCQAKNRLGLPDELPLVWDEYAKHLIRPAA